MQEEKTGFDGPVPIEKRSLHEQIASQIRDMIIEGYLKSGDRIDEVSLATKLGVSRTPFREALRTLAAEGLIDSKRSRGSVVRTLTPKDVHDMLELLGHIEALAGKLVCENASDKQIAEMLDLHEEMLGLWRSRRRMEYYKLNQDFHSRLSLYCGNQILAETQANLQARLKRIRFLGTRTYDYWDIAVEEHEEMAAALRVRDGDRLGEAMKQHLTGAWERVQEKL